MTSSTSTARPGVTGDHTDAGVPHGSTSLTPFLAVRDAARAVEFYREVLDARVIDVTEMGGVVVHAELDLGNGRLQVGEAHESFGLVPQPEGDRTCFSLGLFCADADATVARAVAAGAHVREPLTDFVSGDRYASVRDPFGVRWTIMSRVEDLSPEESAARVAAWAAQHAQG